MRCPAIEGIETELLLVHVDSPIGWVECVAPLSRGLKLPADSFARVFLAARRMRCPAIEGIETQRLRRRDALPRRPVECVAPLSRGLKRVGDLVREGAVDSDVECVAPLSRGLKQLCFRIRRRNVFGLSNALPRYRGD